MKFGKTNHRTLEWTLQSFKDVVFKLYFSCRLFFFFQLRSYSEIRCTKTEANRISEAEAEGWRSVASLVLWTSVLPSRCSKLWGTQAESELSGNSRTFLILLRLQETVMSQGQWQSPDLTSLFLTLSPVLLPMYLSAACHGWMDGWLPQTVKKTGIGFISSLL